MRAFSLLAFVSVSVAASICFGGFTPIGPSAAGEPAQGAIMGNLYGGTFHSIGEDFFNGSITLRRLDDDLPTDPMAYPSFVARPVAKFSNNSQSLAMSLGGQVSHLFDVTGYGYNVNSTSAAGKAMGGVMSFVRTGDSGTHSSDKSLNADGRDHMISYEVLGLSSKHRTWLMFWEDLDLTSGLPKRRTHSDFNDLVVEVRATSIPLPAAVWAGGGVLGVAAVCRKRIGRIVGM